MTQPRGLPASCTCRLLTKAPAHQHNSHAARAVAILPKHPAAVKTCLKRRSTSALRKRTQDRGSFAAQSPKRWGVAAGWFRSSGGRTFDARASSIALGPARAPAACRDAVYPTSSSVASAPSIEERASENDHVKLNWNDGTQSLDCEIH